MAFTNFESFKNAASANDSGAFVRIQNAHVFDIDASTPSLHYAVYYINQTENINEHENIMFHM